MNESINDLTKCIFYKQVVHLFVACSGCHTQYQSTIIIAENDGLRLTAQGVREALNEAAAQGWIRGMLPSLRLLCPACLAKLKTFDFSRIGPECSLYEI